MSRIVIGLLLFIIFYLPTTTFAQNPPTCDSQGICPDGWECRNGSKNACVLAGTPQEPAPQKCTYDNLNTRGKEPRCPEGSVCDATQFRPHKDEGICITRSPENTCEKDSDCKESNQICDNAGPFTAKRCKVGSREGSFFNKCTEQQIREGKCTGASGVPCPNGQAGINTALGCLNPEPSALVQSILKFSVGVGGGIAFLLMIFGAFQMITSAGSAEALKAGQERFYSAIIGLLFLIFSVLLLKIIGVDILGFGTYFGLP